MARREREPLEMVAWARRAIKAAGRHVGNADEFELAEFASLQTDVAVALRLAVLQQRSYGRSWTYIGAALGISRQAAQERFG